MWSSSTCRSHGRGCRSRCTTSPGRSGASRPVPPRPTQHPPSGRTTRGARAPRAPARVRSLTLVNAFARLAPPDAAGGLRMLARLVLLGVAPMSVVAAFVARGLFPEPQQAHLYRLAVASLGRTSRWTYLASIGALVAFDARARLDRVACPTLVVAGERDRTVSLASKAALGRDIPGARVELVPDSGHVTNRDQPTIFNRLVLDFLATHRGVIRPPTTSR